MNIERLGIHNYKSLVDFELINPNSFSVFVGPNAAGKSNIFEALEFLSHYYLIELTDRLFGGYEVYVNRNAQQENHIKQEDYYNQRQHIKDILHISYREKLVGIHLNDYELDIGYENIDGIYYPNVMPDSTQDNLKWFHRYFSRIFIGKNELVKVGTPGDLELNPAASNLASVLKRILKNETIREEFLEWVELLIPEFENISVHSDNISGHDTLLIKEKYTDKPFTTNLISDGTFNILALLTAVYQSNKPQFLCIEEPENGLNPYVIKELVGFFREMCEEKGHIIWLNTHSQTLVSQLTSDEIILIDKKEGITQAKQLNGFNLHGLTMDEAWLTNALGGGLPW